MAPGGPGGPREDHHVRDPDEALPADDDGGDPDAEADLGVPFAGEVVAPERRTDCWATLRFGEPVDWRALFGRDDAPRVVDLGCGNGRYLLSSAVARPTHDHLGVDLVPPAVRHAARRAGERGLANLRFAWGDGVELLFHGLLPGGVAELHVYHPQPYYDASRVGRRMLGPGFFLRAWEVLRPDGLLVLQTDNPRYWSYVRAVAPRLFRLREHPAPWPDAPAGRTRRELVARAQGLPIFRALARPRAINPARAAKVARHMPRPTFDARRERADPGAPGPL